MNKIMNKILLSLLFVSVISQAQTSKTINLSTPGTLSSTLSSTEKNKLIELTISGNIDARDIKSLRDEILKLKTLDLSEATIHSYNGNLGTSNSTVYSANELPEYAFYNNNTGSAKTTLQTVILPTNLTAIADYAFYKCSNLNAITFSPSLVSIGIESFRLCSSLTNVILPNSLETIKYGAFRDCSSIIEVVIPDNVTNMEDRVFSACLELSSVVIGNSVLHIGEYAFSHCTKLREITIGNSVLTIGYSAFYQCIVLENFVIPQSVTSIDYGAFCFCIALTEVNIPNSVISISEGSFKQCSELYKVTFGNSLESIGKRAFSDCNKLKIINSHNSTPPVCGDDVFASFIYNSETGTFERKTFVEIINVPVNSVNTYKTAPVWNEFHNQIQGNITTNIPQEKCDLYKVYALNNSIGIEGISIGDKIKIYSISGQLLKQFAATNNKEIISLNSQEVYIVLINLRSFKVITK